MRSLLPILGGGALAFVVLLSSCATKKPQETTYFERTISPILTTTCVRTNTGAGCHVIDARGNALGNLGVETYEGVAKRRDLLVDYGPYGQPAFLLKNIEPIQVEVQGYDGSRSVVTTDIKHAGGSVLDATGSAYQTLRRWIQAGATENNTGVPPQNTERLPCNPFVPSRPDFDSTRDPPRGDFGAFRDRVNPILTGSNDDDRLKQVACAAGNCHGTIANTLYLTCGTTPEQIRWNYLAAQEYLGQTPEQSELLRRPLSPSQGGAYHEGGVLFTSPSDDAYRAIEGWAREHGPPVVGQLDEGFLFFAKKVQPVLVKKGCMMIQCHSAGMFHDYRLRGGSGGSFSLSATRKNYELSLQQLAVESEDPAASRMVRKNLYRPEVCSVGGCDKPAGIVHRGGPLFEDFGGQAANVKACADAKHDYDNGELDKIPAFCVMTEWLRRERIVYKLAPLSAIIYVKRPVGSVKRAQDFDVYAPGAELHRVSASITNGVLTVEASSNKSLNDGCGLSATADIRRPQVNWQGTKVAFAARSSASEPFAVYEMNVDGTNCAKHPKINEGGPSANGLLIHNFDPTYAPPEGGPSRIVFASTRGNLVNGPFDYSGPQRTPADPSKPNANLYVHENDGTIRQLTYLLNMERQPSFMTDGRLIFAAEKRAPNFAQVALRRINLDGGDYHPLYAQRGSIGFPEATQVVELADKNFAAIFSDRTTQGGGALGVFNRSIGIDFTSTDPNDYPIDKGVIDPNRLEFPDLAFFLHSLKRPDPAGIYASPAPLPSTQLLVSFGAASGPANFNGDYDVYVMDPGTGVKTKLFGDAGSAEVDAVAVYERLVRPIFRSTLDEPNGHTTILPGKSEAEVHVLDVPVLASLLFQNTPTGRVIDPDIRTLNIYEDLPPTPNVTSLDNLDTFGANDAFGRLYVRRKLLGAVPLQDDGSAKFAVPGGLPIVLALPETKLQKERGLPRFQRESMVFAPGEYVHQSFKQQFFGALCGACHGSVTGRAVDAALQPDFITQASATKARSEPPFPLLMPPSARRAAEGAPPSP